MVAGTVTLDMSFFSVPSACPCVVEMASILYFAYDSMMQDFYEDEAADVVITEIEWLEDDVARLVGRFEATLQHRADFRSELDEETSISVEGTFEVRAVRSVLRD